MDTLCTIHFFCLCLLLFVSFLPLDEVGWGMGEMGMEFGFERGVVGKWVSCLAMGWVFGKGVRRRREER